jgi:hypothetical protein
MGLSVRYGVGSVASIGALSATGDMPPLDGYGAVSGAGVLSATGVHLPKGTGTLTSMGSMEGVGQTPLIVAFRPVWAQHATVVL